ncbi:MAG: protein-glutamate O-methyltransferase CheR [Lachnospiraceae bacterium]|jgi:chemotaxis protein methyltransferase CheR|nr:protein-glutamate O-methyltransferase CheR [Lachnospiraceae bacterium]
MANDYEKFKKDVLSITKIDLNAYKEKQMRRRIDSLITRHKIADYDAFIGEIKVNESLLREFVNFLTINVSEFYRNTDQWELMDQEIIPKLISRFGKNLKIWSAACSTGDEPYSLVMAFSKYIPLNQIHVIATDIDKQAIEKAKAGLYGAKSIAGVPDEFKKKYFTEIAGSYQISDEIKRCVEFKERNLLKDDYEKDCNLILCRNVVIYFTEETKDMIYKKFCDSLVPGGFLFIGSTEQIMNYKEMGYTRFKSFFFQKGDMQ